MHEQDDKFPRNVISYSALKYLQKKLTDQVARLPRGFDSRKDWESYRDGLIRALHDLLPVWELKDPGRVVSHSSLDLHTDLCLEVVDIGLDGEFLIPIHIYRPRVPEGAPAPMPLPAVIVCPGFQGRKNDPGTSEMCSALARRGIVAAAVEYGARGERAERPDLVTDMNNTAVAGELIGITNVGLRVMTNVAVLEYLRTRPDVDADRIGIVGLCQGSIATWFTAAVRQDLAAVAPLCGVTTYQAIILTYANSLGGWTGITPYVHGLLNHGDVQHVLACTAPRPLYAQNNIMDKHWPLAGFSQVRDFVQSVYELYGASEQCRFSVEDGPHAFAEPFVTNLAGWFAGVL